MLPLTNAQGRELCRGERSLDAGLDLSGAQGCLVLGLTKYQRQRNMFKISEKHGDWYGQQMKQVLGAALQTEK